MKKSNIALIVLVIILVIVIIIGFTPKKEIDRNIIAEKPTVKIGVIAVLSGSNAHLGEEFLNGIKLAKEQLKETKYNYELIVEDDRLDPKMSSNAVNKLVNVDKVDAIISLSSGTGNVVSPVAQANKVIHISLASDANIAKGSFNFIHWTPPEEEAKAWVDEAVKRGIKSFSAVVMNQQGTIATLDAVKKYIKNRDDIKLVDEEVFNLGERDFRSMLLKAKEKNPDLYMIYSFSPELEIIAKQFRELNIDKPMSSIEAFEFTEQPELFEGQWYVNAADPTNKFIELYKNRYNKNPGIGSPNGYDQFNLVVTAYEKIDNSKTKPSHEVVAQALSKIKDFDGALGKLYVDEEGIVHSNAVVRMVKNGEFITI